MTLTPGTPVIVTSGMAKGLRGVVHVRWLKDFDEGIPLWVVRFGGMVDERVIRGDYLERDE